MHNGRRLWALFKSEGKWVGLDEESAALGPDLKFIE